MKKERTVKKLNLKINNGNVIILDGKFLCYRTMYSKGMSELEHDNVKVGMIFGFFNTIKSVIKKFNPTNLVIMWDGVGSIRRQEYPEYKNKDKFKYLKPEQINTLKQLSIEYPKLIEICDDIGFASYILNDYEADDLIALFVEKFKTINKIIVTKDEDMYQCIDKTTLIYDLDKKIQKNYHWFKRTYDIEPIQWKLVKQNAGCTSDNVPGIKGVAELTAIKMIKGDEKALKKLESADKDELELWKKLTDLPHHTLKDYDIKYKITKINIDEFIKFCQLWNFRSFLEDLSEFESLT